MARHQHRDRPASTSQRQFRIGELVRHALVVPPLLFAPALASAEVCDKAVGEGWRSENGPVWLLNPNGFPIGLAILIGGLVLVVATKLRWFAYLVSAFLVFSAGGIVFADLVPGHDIYLAQIREGCRSYQTDLMDVGLIITFGFAYAWLGHWTKPQVGNR